MYFLFDYLHSLLICALRQSCKNRLNALIGLKAEAMPNDASNPIYSRDDTAEDTEVDMMAVGRVVKENRETHVMIWEHFFLLIKMVSKHPRKPKTCLRRGGKKGESWRIRKMRLKSTKKKLLIPHFH